MTRRATGCRVGQIKLAFAGVELTKRREPWHEGTDEERDDEHDEIGMIAQSGIDVGRAGWPEAAWKDPSGQFGART